AAVPLVHHVPHHPVGRDRAGRVDPLETDGLAGSPGLSGRSVLHKVFHSRCPDRRQSDTRHAPRCPIWPGLNRTIVLTLTGCHTGNTGNDRHSWHRGGPPGPSDPVTVAVMADG